jgi:hypothetical protein
MASTITTTGCEYEYRTLYAVSHAASVCNYDSIPSSPGRPNNLLGGAFPRQIKCDVIPSFKPTRLEGRRPPPALPITLLGENKLGSGGVFGSMEETNDVFLLFSSVTGRALVLRGLVVHPLGGSKGSATRSPSPVPFPGFPQGVSKR